MKLKLVNTDEKLYLDKITASKHIFGYISNTIASDYLTISLVFSLIFLISDFSTLNSAASTFPAPNCPTSNSSIFLIFGLFAFPYLSFFIVFLVDLDTFSHNLSFISLVNGNIVKFLVEVIANFFHNNFFIIAYLFHNSITNEQALNMSFKVGFINLFSGINIIFNVWS